MTTNEGVELLFPINKSPFSQLEKKEEKTMKRFNFFQHRNKHYFDPCWQETFAQHLILKIVLSNTLSFGCIWRIKRFARYFNSFLSSGFRKLQKSEMVKIFLIRPSLGSLARNSTFLCSSLTFLIDTGEGRTGGTQ